AQWLLRGPSPRHARAARAAPRTTPPPLPKEAPECAARRTLPAYGRSRRCAPGFVVSDNFAKADLRRPAGQRAVHAARDLVEISGWYLLDRRVAFEHRQRRPHRHERLRRLGLIDYIGLVCIVVAHGRAPVRLAFVLNECGLGSAGRALRAR